MTRHNIFDTATKRALENFFNAIGGEIATIDHVGFKCSSNAEYDAAIKTFFPVGSRAADSDWVYQSYIPEKSKEARRIAYAHIPIPVNIMASNHIHPIHYLEIQDQKLNGSQKTGIDHVEILPISGVSSETLVEHLRNCGFVIPDLVDKKARTIDFSIPRENAPDLIIKIASEPLIQKIIRDEMLRLVGVV